jgi:hypothetical protein
VTETVDSLRLTVLNSSGSSIDRARFRRNPVPFIRNQISVYPDNTSVLGRRGFRLIIVRRQRLPVSASIEVVTRCIEEAIKAEMRSRTKEAFWVTHYGANDIHPRHLVYWIVVGSDKEKRRLEQDADLLSTLRALLDDFDYPIATSRSIRITGRKARPCKT